MRRRHADNGERLIEYGERAANGGLAAAKVDLPERVTHHDGPRTASAAVVVGRDQPATLGRDAKAAEKIAADP